MPNLTDYISATHLSCEAEEMSPCIQSWWNTYRLGVHCLCSCVKYTWQHCPCEIVYNNCTTFSSVIKQLMFICMNSFLWTMEILSKCEAWSRLLTVEHDVFTKTKNLSHLNFSALLIKVYIAECCITVVN